MMAAVLILESITVLLALLVVTKIDSSRLSIGLVLTLAVAMIAAIRFLARPWGVGLVMALQLGMLSSGLLVGALGALGLVFMFVWVVLLLMRRDVARKMELGQLPGQRS